MRFTFTFLFAIALFSAVAQQTTKTTLYFEFNSDKLVATSQEQLDELLNSFGEQQPSKITVKGFTDKSGSNEYNQTLSSQRAMIIAESLQAKLPNIKIATEYLGSSSLLTDNDDQQSINRRVEIFSEYSVPRQTIVEVQPFMEDVLPQLFTVNLDDTVTIRGAKGTYIKISPGSIQDKNGTLAKGEASLIIKEYYDPSDILLSGLHSSSKERLLQTGGMFHLAIVQKGDTMSKETKKSILIRMPQYNSQLNNMNVFAMDNKEDSTQWKDTEIEFTQLPSYWIRPYDLALRDNAHESDQFYSNIRTGYNFTEQYYVARPTFHFLWKLRWQRPIAKRVEITTSKTHDDTIKIHTKIKYRRYGFSLIGKRTLDTSYTICFQKAEYEAPYSNINWINCDRFYDYKKKVEFTAATPGFSGLTVMAYFKKINSFLQADHTSRDYIVKNVPAGTDVILVAVGKKGNDFFFGTLPTNTSLNGPQNIAVAKISESDFRQRMKNL